MIGTPAPIMRMQLSSSTTMCQPRSSQGGCHNFVEVHPGQTLKSAHMMNAYDSPTCVHALLLHSLVALTRAFWLNSLLMCLTSQPGSRSEASM
eukprot:6478047-Amphidinium_carterae.1